VPCAPDEPDAGHTCRPCVGVARIIADGMAPPAHRRDAPSRRYRCCN